MKIHARPLAALFFVSLVIASRGGVPGTGVVIDAISDEFEPPWTFDYQNNLSSNGFWYGSFRGAPEILELVTPPGGGDSTSTTALRLRSVDTADVDYPGAEDLVSQFYNTTLFGRAVTFAEEPSYVTWAWFPPISTWPQTVDGSNCFGFRLAARDHTLVGPDNANGEYYPSIWAYRGSDGQGYLVARVGDGYVEDVPIASLPAGGWYTLGMSWNAQGRTEYYAASGRVALQAGHLLYTDTLSARKMETVPYHFYSLRFPATSSPSPDFLADRCRVFTRALPRLPTLTSLGLTGSTFRMNIAGTTAGFLYRVEKRTSFSLGAWQEVERFLSDGLPRTFTTTATGSQTYYRVARGTETPPAAPSLVVVSARRVPLKSPEPTEAKPLRRTAAAPIPPPAAAFRPRTAPTW
ncbi:MAG TPA: hypothetical protein VGO11_24050 [Chthoniobacteraceae bacterium]|nr:hypothetical protein [Chthoniobacteraceae bacterium]